MIIALFAMLFSILLLVVPASCSAVTFYRNDYWKPRYARAHEFNIASIEDNTNLHQTTTIPIQVQQIIQSIKSTILENGLGKGSRYTGNRPSRSIRHKVPKVLHFPEKFAQAAKALGYDAEQVWFHVPYDYPVLSTSPSISARSVVYTFKPVNDHIYHHDTQDMIDNFKINNNIDSSFHNTQIGTDISNHFGTVKHFHYPRKNTGAFLTHH